ncbi:MAG TPA: hypothetical protein DHU96_04235 [Actinobacteria bacterium]|nr:hypothetical protein [Actinomycetota bacterium]
MLSTPASSRGRRLIAYRAARRTWIAQRFQGGLERGPAMVAERGEHVAGHRLGRAASGDHPQMQAPAGDQAQQGALQCCPASTSR